MTAVALGLGAALCWGLGDVLARLASRAVGAYRALFYAQLVGVGMLTAYAGSTGELARAVGGASPAAWAWAVGTGAVFTVATFAFYRAMETGVLAIVSPITASYAAVTVLLAVAAGETLTPARTAGIGAALVGVVVASVPARAAHEPGTRAGHAVRWALVAAIAFGVTFWLLGFRVTPAFGGVAAVWVLRTVAAVLLLGAARPARASLAPPRGRTAWLVVAIGALDTLGFVANNLGTTRGLVSVVSVLGSLFSAVTVLVAWGT